LRPAADEARYSVEELPDRIVDAEERRMQQVIGPHHTIAAFFLTFPTLRPVPSCHTVAGLDGELGFRRV
jgi:hypothetical protein